MERTTVWVTTQLGESVEARQLFAPSTLSPVLLTAAGSLLGLSGGLALLDARWDAGVLLAASCLVVWLLRWNLVARAPRSARLLLGSSDGLAGALRSSLSATCPAPSPWPLVEVSAGEVLLRLPPEVHAELTVDDAPMDLPAPYRAGAWPAIQLPAGGRAALRLHGQASVVLERVRPQLRSRRALDGRLCRVLGASAAVHLLVAGLCFALPPGPLDLPAKAPAPPRLAPRADERPCWIGCLGECVPTPRKRPTRPRALRGELLPSPDRLTQLTNRLLGVSVSPESMDFKRVPPPLFHSWVLLWAGLPDLLPIPQECFDPSGLQLESQLRQLRRCQRSWNAFDHCRALLPVMEANDELAAARLEEPRSTASTGKKR